MQAENLIVDETGEINEIDLFVSRALDPLRQLFEETRIHALPKVTGEISETEEYGNIFYLISEGKGLEYDKRRRVQLEKLFLFFKVSLPTRYGRKSIDACYRYLKKTLIGEYPTKNTKEPLVLVEWDFGKSRKNWILEITFSFVIENQIIPKTEEVELGLLKKILYVHIEDKSLFAEVPPIPDDQEILE